MDGRSEETRGPAPAAAPAALDADLDALLRFAIEAARAAGRLQLDALDRRPAVSLKSARELVTEVDLACEALIAERIAATFPTHALLAEEGHDLGGRGAGGAPPWRWIVDPVDGTTNYSRRLPTFAVSIGLEAPGLGPTLGVVYAPYLDELFYGARGRGAWLVRGESPPRPLRVSATAALDEAVVTTGFAYVQNETPNDNFANWERVSRRTRAVRRGGSAALDLAYVADGRFDAFWEMHLKPYDVAAGAVLVREAGGRVSDLFQGEDWLHGQTMLASNGALHEALLAELAPVRPDGHVRLPGA